MREHGIDISTRQSRHLNTLAGQRFDHMITLCDRLCEICPEFPGPAKGPAKGPTKGPAEEQAETIHWSIPDPATAGGSGSGSGSGSEEDTYPAFRAVAADLNTRIAFLLARINSDGGVT